MRSSAAKVRAARANEAPASVPVVILCGGRGTRLQEGSGLLPKPLVEVGTRPMLWHIMKIYAHHGLDRFVLCLGYKGQKIREYFLNYGVMNSTLTVGLGARKGQVAVHDQHREESWTVTMVDTGENSMTGSRIKRIQPFVGDSTFMLTYGDGVTSVDMTQLLRFHRAHGKLCTVTGVHPPARFGEFILRGNAAIKFSEKPQGQGGYINGGFMVCEPGLFKYLSKDESCVFEREPMERLAKDGQLMVYKHDGFWQCMDTMSDLQLLNALWETSSIPWKVWE